MQLLSLTCCFLLAMACLVLVPTILAIPALPPCQPPCAANAESNTAAIAAADNQEKAAKEAEAGALYGVDQEDDEDIGPPDGPIPQDVGPQEVPP